MPGTYALSSRIGNSSVPPLHLGNFTISAGQDLDLGEISGEFSRQARSGRLDLSLRRSDQVPLEDLFVFLHDASGHEMGSIFMDALGHGNQALVPGEYELHIHPGNAQGRRRKFTISADQELKIDLLLRSATKRYLTFPVPVPDDWQGVKRIDYVIKTAAGEAILDGSMDSAEAPITMVPSLEIGQHSIELTTDDGRRYVGDFAVINLKKSNVTIVVEVRE